MTTFAEVTDPLLRTYLPVPPLSVGICDLCHRAAPGYARCYSCNETARQVSHPVDLVVPITFCESGGQLHHSLRSYKDAPQEALRSRFTQEVAALFGRFMAAHAACIAKAAGGPWSYLVPVPSGHGRAGQHPLVRALSMLRHPPGQLLDALGPGASPLDHKHPRDDAFVVTDDVEGKAVLVVDDTWTSGAAVQSAASALQLAGAKVVAAVPIARFIDPNFNVEVQRPLLDHLRKTPFLFDTCCLEASASPS